jgi:hypothetical protein
MIKVFNNRDPCQGSLFHYAHFICDCLFPEIINDIHKYDEVFREKNIHQTIGNFHRIYTEVMMNKTTELPKNGFNNLNISKIMYKNKEDYCDKIYFDKFRLHIFRRFKIDPLIFDNNYPEVLLIKRGDRIDLIDDIELKQINTNVTTGKERREIDKVDEVEKYLKNKHNNNFTSIYLERTSFEEQVKYFNNAKLIICAHGASMSNMFFCKEFTKIIEITCNNSWIFFDIISTILNLNHIKCHINEYNEIIKYIELNEI